MEVDFIEEIKLKKHLWDVTDNLYAKKKLKRLTYMDLAEKFKKKWPESSSLFNADSLMRKFSRLRTHFQKEFRKAQRLKSGSWGVGFLPKWEHFLRLAFLQDTVTSQKSTTKSELIGLIVNAEETENSSFEHMQVDEVSEIPHCSTETFSPSRKRPRTSTKQSEVDEDEAFGYNVFLYLKSFDDPCIKELCRLNILKAMMKCNNGK